MRAFIAIELDDYTRQLLFDTQRRLKDAGIKGNFSRRENLHLTIKFLGEVSTDQVKMIRDIILKTASKYSPMTLTLNGIGEFYKGNKSIIWAGLKINSELHLIHAKVDDMIDAVIPGMKEKSFSPHITLIREANSNKIKYNNIMNLNDHSFEAAGLSLMESTRLDGILTYIRRDFVSFKKM